MQELNQISAYTDISRYAAMRADARRDGSDAYAQVAKEFEALFIQMMLKAARDASMEGGLFNSNELKFYREMMDSQVALAMADQGGFGFGETLRQQLGEGAVDDERGPLVLPEPRVFNQVLRSAPTTRAIGETSDNPARDAFIDRYLPDAKDAAARLNVSPRLLVAQAALETGWGEHMIRFADGRPSYNLFGIKAGAGWEGERINVETLEYIHQQPMKVAAEFRAYPNPSAAFNDYVDFVSTQQRYAGALAHGGDETTYMNNLQKAGYATDPAYAKKVLAIHDQIKAGDMLASQPW